VVHAGTALGTALDGDREAVFTQRRIAEGLRLSFAPTPARHARLTVIKNSANPAMHVQELKLFSSVTP